MNLENKYWTKKIKQPIKWSKGIERNSEGGYVVDSRLPTRGLADGHPRQSLGQARQRHREQLDLFKFQPGGHGAQFCQGGQHSRRSYGPEHWPTAIVRCQPACHHSTFFSIHWLLDWILSVSFLQSLDVGGATAQHFLNAAMEHVNATTALVHFSINFFQKQFFEKSFFTFYFFNFFF